MRIRLHWLATVAFVLSALATTNGCGGGGEDESNHSKEPDREQTETLIEQDSAVIREMIFLAIPGDTEAFPKTLDDCEIYPVRDRGGLVVTIWSKRVSDVKLLRPLPILDSEQLRQSFLSPTSAKDIEAEGSEEERNAWEKFLQVCSDSLDATGEWCVEAWDWIVELQRDIRDEIGKWWDSQPSMSSALFCPLIASTAYLADAVRYASAEGYLVSLLTQLGVKEDKALIVANCVDLVFQIATTIFKKAERDLWNLMADLLNVVVHPIDAIGQLFDGMQAIYELACVSVSFSWAQWMELFDNGLDAVLMQIGSTELTTDELMFALTNDDAPRDLRSEAFATVAYSGLKVTASIIGGAAIAKVGAKLFTKIRALTKALIPDGKFGLTKGWPNLPDHNLSGVGVDSSLRRLQGFVTGYSTRFRKVVPDFPSDGLHDVHHAVPKSLYAELAETPTDSVNLLRNFRGVERSVHVQITREWNAFHRYNPKPTRAELLAEVERIDIKYASKMRFPPPEAVADDYVEYALLRGRVVSAEEKASVLAETRAYQDRVRGIQVPKVEPGSGD